MYRRCRSVRSTRPTRPTCGPGWTASARRATSFSRSRITPTSRMGACIRPMSTLHGRPIDKAYAESRMRNEPLIEIKQVKGQSETHPLLSPNDEFANYEILTYLLGNPAGRIPHVIGSYARQALKDGLALAGHQGLQPLQVRFRRRRPTRTTPACLIARTISSGPTESPTEPSRRACRDICSPASIRAWRAPPGSPACGRRRTRAKSIFNAMKRKETFAVSGPHIKVRFFGGWNYAETATAEQRRAFWKFVPDWIKDRDWVKAAYAQGVPMGGDLTPMPAGDKAPSFAVWAVKDPTSGNLDRIQIIKGWTKSGQSFEKSSTSPGRVTVSPTSGPVSCRRSQTPSIVEKATYTNSIGARRTEDRVDRSRVRSERSGVLLCPCARNSNAALDDDPGRETRHRTARRGGGNRSRAGVEFPDLVQPDRRGAESRQIWSHHRRSQETGGSRPQRCSAEGADRRQVPVAAEQCDRHEVQDHL